MKSTHLIIGAHIGIRRARLIDKAMTEGYAGTENEYKAFRLAEEFARKLDDADAASDYAENARQCKAVSRETAKDNPNP